MRFHLQLLFVGLLSVAPARGQTEQRYYAPVRSVSAYAEYANSSSHIVLGEDCQRKFVGVAIAYQRGISATHWMAWSYSAEISPLQFESDPTLAGQRLTVIVDGTTKVYNTRFFQQFPIENRNLYPNQTFSGTTLEGAPFTEELHNDLERRWTYAPSVTPI